MQVPVAGQDTQVQKEEEKRKMQKQREQIRLAQMGDKAVRDRFVEENMGLVYHVVRRFMGRGYETEDLFQIGSIGLIKAVQNFNMEYEVCFSTYAVYLIQGEIRRFLRDDGPIKVSRALKENGAKVWREKEKLRHKLNRDPTLQEIAEAVGMEPEEIVMALEANAEVESLDRDTLTPGIEAKGIKTGEKTENDKLLDRIVLKQVLDRLKEEDKRLILLRYQRGLTQTEVGKIMQMTQVQVSRREKKILGILRKELE